MNNKIRIFIIALTILFPFVAFAQTEADYLYVDSLLQNGHQDEAYNYAKNKHVNTKPSDSLYKDAVIMHFIVADYYQRFLFTHNAYKKSLIINQEMLEIIQTHKNMFTKEFSDQTYFIYRNMIVCYTGLGDYKKAQKYRSLLYKAKKKEYLPCEYELCHYFNFDFIKLDTLNVWGYEWYDQLPKERFSQSFTKIVYYVYSTDANGNDKELLYRLHVLMFHGIQQKFDYIMDKRIQTENGEISGSMYSYTYKEDIDFEKLHNDVLEIVKENKRTDTQRFIQMK